MKTRLSVVLLFVLPAVLSLSIAAGLIPLVQKRASASNRNANLDERIRRVENGLLPPFFVKGQPDAAMRLVDRMRFYKTPGVSVAVIDGGKMEWARGYGALEAGGSRPVTPETLFQAASISKPVTAMAVLRLVQENKLSLDEEVNIKLVSWKVPENEFTREQKVTLRNLLSHSAGATVHGFEGYGSDEKVPTLVQILNGAAPANSKPIRVGGVPNREFRYSGGGYLITQQLLTDVTGRPFPALMRETVLQKLGMSRSTYQQPLPRGLLDSAAAGHTSSGETIKGNWQTYPEMAAAGLWTTPTDLAKFAIEIQKSKNGKSNRVLSTRMIDEMLAPQVGGWGLGLELHGEDGSARFGHSGANGGYRCFLVAYVTTGQGAAVMTNSDSGGELAEEILRSIAREYHWLGYLPQEEQSSR
jgi:CubicO group peptidase (beta-lactamase class C family)